MKWIQRIFRLKPRARGFHVITDEVLGQLPELREIEVGLLHLFIQHTSASLGSMRTSARKCGATASAISVNSCQRGRTTTNTR